MPGLHTVIINGIKHGVTPWTSVISATDVIKAEVADSKLVITEATFCETVGSNTVTIAVKRKDGSGDLIYQITIPAGGCLHVPFSSWLVGDKADAASAGDLHVTVTGTGTLSAFWIGHSYK